MSLAAVANHVWQSTICAAIIALATIAFRTNRASVRHALWLTASVKFLVPVALLAAIGQQVGWRAPERMTRHEAALVFESVSEPFTRFEAHSIAESAGEPAALERTAPTIAFAAWAAGFLFVLASWAKRWRVVAAIVLRGSPVREGRALYTLTRMARARGVTRAIALVASDAPLEPGVFGIVRPVLIWPRTIAAHLDDDQIAAVLTHEVSHVRRHDNLTAALHMAVEAVFWFHPLVWWIGARLIDERERACDEEVLGSGYAAAAYAETILKSCRVYLESPLACVAGVTGSNLQTRIERIMRDDVPRPLAVWRKLMLGALLIGPVGTPIVAAAATAPRVSWSASLTPAAAAMGQAPTFEVASIKPNKSPDTKVMIQPMPGGRFVATNVTLRQLIRNAYQLQDFQISGGPPWLDTERFDVVAKADAGGKGDPFEAEQGGLPGRGQLMLRALLAERFKLEVHTGTREMPVYALVNARTDGTLGPQLRRSARNCDVPQADGRGQGGKAALTEAPPCGMRVYPGTILAGGITLADLGAALSPQVERTVEDRSGLAGRFEFTLRWTPDQIPQGFDRKASAIGLPPIDADGPALFTALREQLGLKIESVKGPIAILVIDRAERPSED